jgi:anthranilate synthase/aminodeoxychorismate synthase-like glutamine amidotransferase
METKPVNVLFIDNFDSFTYNLVDEFAKRKCPTRVYRADTPLDDVKKAAAEFGSQLLVLSPGPGNPDTAGITLAAIDAFKDKLPILGVCLGHQSLVQYFGGHISHAPQVMHGKPSRITHNGKELFEGLENPLQVGRYHSLCAMTMPDCMDVTAEFEGIVMGARHKTLPIYGVQFHPESILTPTGGRIIENMLTLAATSKTSL